jgi:MFS family permease
MRSYRHYYHNKVYQAIHSDFWRLELSIWLQTLAWSMITLFVPILMLRYGYSLEAVIIYEVLFYGIDTPLNFLARKLVLSWGAKAVTIIGIVCAIAFAVCFHYLSLGNWMIFGGLAILQALFDTFYWVGHFYLFIESSGKPEKAGRSTGIVNAVRIFGGMLGPALGAALLLTLGQNALLIIAAFIFVLSLIPLFSLKHLRNKPASTISLKEFMSEPREKWNYLLFALYSIHDTAEGVIWPIFIFVVLGTLNSIALLAIVVSLSTIILSYVTGIITRKSAPLLISAGSICAAAIWILRLIIPSPALYYGSVLVIGFFAILISVPIESSIVERGRIKDALWASTLRNAEMFTGFLLFAILLPLIAIFKISFLAAALSLFILIFAVRWMNIAPKKSGI